MYYSSTTRPSQGKARKRYTCTYAKIPMTRLKLHASSDTQHPAATRKHCVHDAGRTERFGAARTSRGLAEHLCQ